MQNNELIKVFGTILVDKNAEIVFDFFANPGNDSLWRKEINQSTLNGTLQLGVMVSEYSYLSKKVSNNLLELKCVQFEKNNVAIFETLHNSTFYLKNKRQVKAITDEKTEVIYTLEFDRSIVKYALGFNLPRFIISMKANTDMKKYLQQLKSLMNTR